MQRIKKEITLVIAALMVTLFFAVAAGAVPGLMNYQGKLLENGVPLTTATPVSMTFKIFIEETDTGGSPIWMEYQDVDVVDGIYAVKLGAGTGTPFDSSLFVDSGRDYWLEVTVGTETLLPRQRLTSVIFALQAENAATLDGFTATELDQSAHATSTDNPHNVTAAQIGAATITDLTWGNLQNIPAEIADGDQTGITTETDPTVPEALKDGVSWTELSGIPTGFADGIDNVGSGDITGVTAGTGLTGGGSSGDVTLDITLPLDLTTSTASAIKAVIKGSNDGNGYGVYGWSGSNYGIYGYSNNSAGVSGINGSTGNEGRLGTGQAAGWFSGDVHVMNGAVGIGTQNPAASLHIANSAIENIAGKHTLYLTETNNSESPVSGFDPAEPYYGIGFRRSWNNTNFSNIKNIAGIYAYGAEGYRGGLVFKTENAVDSEENPDVVAMVIRPDGNVGVGTTTPETLLHVSAGTSGDATLILEADTDNNNEADQPSVQFRQDGGLVTGSIGFNESSNNLRIQSTHNTEFYNGDGEARKLVATFDTDGNLHVDGNITHEPKTGYLWLSAGEFIKTWGSINSSAEQFPMKIDVASGWLEFVAAVHLPDKAVMQQFLAYFDVSDNLNEILVRLYNFEFSQQVETSLASVNNNDGLSGYRYAYTANNEDPIVDNIHKAYYVKIYFYHHGDDSLCRFRGARITYEYYEE